MTPPSQLLLDIEGTTTPGTFVTGSLFPFARKRLRAFLEAHAKSPEVQACMKSLEEEHARERAKDQPPPWNPKDRVAAACTYVEWLMDRDRKTTSLKTLQGLIWQEGFASGALVAPVYDDVPLAFERWRAASRPIAIFSSGSVLAQRLLFAHTSAGDLTGFLSAWFDTTTGGKKEAESYRKIAAAVSKPPNQTLFVSDVLAELDAAAEAGMRTALCVRPGAPAAAPEFHPVIRTFAELE